MRHCWLECCVIKSHSCKIFFPKISHWLGVLHVEYLKEQASAASVKISGFRTFCSPSDCWVRAGRKKNSSEIEQGLRGNFNRERKGGRKEEQINQKLLKSTGKKVHESAKGSPCNVRERRIQCLDPLFNQSDWKRANRKKGNCRNCTFQQYRQLREWWDKSNADLIHIPGKAMGYWGPSWDHGLNSSHVLPHVWKNRLWWQETAFSIYFRAGAGADREGRVLSATMV